MSETANKLFSYNEFEPSGEQDSESMAYPINLTGGHYADPDPNVVNWINQKFTDPEQNIEATVIKAFEFAGIIKPLKDTVRPLERSGLLPKGNQPIYIENDNLHSPFMDRREEQLLDEFISDDAVRNQLLLDIKRHTVARLAYQPDEIDELWAWGKVKTKAATDMPSVLKVLTVMLGIRQPDNRPSENPDSRATPTPAVTRELAPDIYFMMLRESEES